MELTTTCRYSVYAVWIFTLLGATASHIINKRVVNGEPALVGSNPHQVSLQVWNGFKWSHLCGGSLITVNKVLTAAHCVDRTPANLMRVVLGCTDLSQHNEFQQNITVSKIVIHRDYQAQTAGFPHDMAVLTLGKNATYTKAVNLVRLSPPLSAVNENATTCHISGWGNEFRSVLLNSNLTQTTMTVISNAECGRLLASITKAAVFDFHICVFEKPKAACNGDSGGPLVCNGYLTGVSTYGVKTCTGSYPSVYSRVSFYYSWIIQQIFS